MTNNGRAAFDLLSEWIANDHPVNYLGREVVETNRKHSTNYGNGLRDLILDIRSSVVVPPTFPGGTPLNRVYSELCWQMRKHRDYPNGYPVDAGAALWTMNQISDKEFGLVDWGRLADDLFGEE